MKKTWAISLPTELRDPPFLAGRVQNTDCNIKSCGFVYSEFQFHIFLMSSANLSEQTFLCWYGSVPFSDAAAFFLLFYNFIYLLYLTPFLHIYICFDLRIHVHYLILSENYSIFPNLDDLNLFHNLAALNISTIFLLIDIALLFPAS